MSIRVAIIGAGAMGIAHAEAYAVCGAEIVAVVDINAALVAAFTQRFGCAGFTEATDLYRLDFDAVSICLPHYLHRDAALLAAQHKKHILMEKPLAITLVEAQEIIDACKAAGVILMVGFTHRFLSCLNELKHRIASGLFGEISLIVDYLAAGGSWLNPPAWYFDKDKAGGGIVMIGNIHSIDRIAWLLNSTPQIIYAVQKQVSPVGSVEDVASATIIYESGTCASVIGYRSPLQNHARRHTLEIYGTLSEATLSLSHDNKQQMTITSQTGVETIEVTDDKPFVREIEEFLNAIQEKRPAKPDGDEGFLSLATVMAMYESSKRGQPIILPNYISKQEFL